jgi:hypothetical protein
VLQGDVPSPANPPKGCNFSPAARRSWISAADIDPEFREIAREAQVACHLYSNNRKDRRNQPPAKPKSEHRRNAERGSDGEVKIIYWQAPSILNPFLSGGTKDVESASMMIEPLARYDEKANWCPGWSTRSRPSRTAACPRT